MTDRDTHSDTGTLYATNLAGTPGFILREAREKAGLSLDEMAVQTKIPLPVLQAIEHDDTAHLGQPVYVRGYLRRYARALNIAESKVMAEFDSRVAARPPSPEPIAREEAPVEEPTASSRPLLWLVVIVIAAAIGGVAYLYFRGGSLATLTRRPPARPVVTRQAPVAAPAPETLAPAPEEAAPVADTPPPQPKAAPAGPASGNPAVQGGPPPVNQPEPGAVSPSPQPGQ
jgi:cytoskeleton protein RodZ